MWVMRMVSEDNLGLVLVVSHTKVQKSHLSFRYKCFDKILIVKYYSPIIISLLN